MTHTDPLPFLAGVCTCVYITVFGIYDMGIIRELFFSHIPTLLFIEGGEGIYTGVYISFFGRI